MDDEFIINKIGNYKIYNVFLKIETILFMEIKSIIVNFTLYETIIKEEIRNIIGIKYKKIDDKDKGINVFYWEKLNERMNKYVIDAFLIISNDKINGQCKSRISLANKGRKLFTDEKIIKLLPEGKKYKAHCKVVMKNGDTVVSKNTSFLLQTAK